MCMIGKLLIGKLLAPSPLPVRVLPHPMKTLFRILLPPLLALLTGAGPAATKTNAPASRFIFAGPEIFPVDYQIAHLHAADFTGLRAVGIGAPEPNALAFLGQNSAAWLKFSGQVWDVRELDGYETPIKDGRLTDVVTGDLNQDGRKDLVFLETAKNHHDIVTFHKGAKLVPANRWQVFEERTFRNRRGDGAEPREALIADVTGDGKNDLIILVHDRILVYPQE